MQSVCYPIRAGFFLGFLFDPENGGDMFLRNVDSLSTVYTALYLRRYNSSIGTPVHNLLLYQTFHEYTDLAAVVFFVGVVTIIIIIIIILKISFKWVPRIRKIPGSNLGQQINCPD
jgi:hypothetical protein